jgi:hypothetical protein
VSDTVEQIFPYFRDTHEYPVSKTIRDRFGEKARYFGVRNAATVDSFQPWIGQPCAVEGVGVGKLLGVERFAHMPPWREGEDVGVVVEIIDENALEPKSGDEVGR